MIEGISFEKGLTHNEILNLSPLSLAFLGDGVWTLLIRSYLCNHSTYKNTSLHKLTTKFVKASFQASFYDSIINSLSQDEQDVAKRARNAKLNTVAKHASLQDYKKATSLEAILGFDYLTKNFDRIKEIFLVVKTQIDDCLKEEKR